jgi:uncharacterized protein YndB with AHSA1/START domain
VTEIVVEQQIDAPPATVYRYLTDSERWTRWQGAQADLDAREGGIFALLMENGMRARGQFVEFEADTRVVFTWGWVDRPGIPPGSTIVTIDLVPSEGGTLLVLTHRDLPDDEVAPHRAGWELHLSRLAGAAAGRRPADGDLVDPR